MSSVSSTAGPVAEPSAERRRFGCTEFLGGALVTVNSGQEDRSHVLTVVLELVSGAVVHALEVEDACGDVVPAVGFAPVYGRLERPAVEVPGVLIARKRLSLTGGDQGQGGPGIQAVGQGDYREG